MSNEIQEAVNKITVAVDAELRRNPPRDFNAVWRHFAMGYTEEFIKSNLKVLQDVIYAAEAKGVSMQKKEA
jgi:hypothetical protein